MSSERPLLGGNVGTVVRIGDTVRRSTGPWTPAVHELLRHLEMVGFAYSPRVLGVDRQGREILSYLDGDTVGEDEPWPRWAWADETLAQAGRLLRAYHDAVGSFRPDGPRVWRFGVGGVGPGEIVCHNDIAPYNVVHRAGRIVGVIDWDLAGPGVPAWDLAFTAWTFVPLHPPEHAARLGAPGEVSRRLRLLCDAYGLADRAGLPSLVHARMAASIAGVEEKAAAGEAPFRRLIADGHLARMKRDLTWFDRHVARWGAALR